MGDYIITRDSSDHLQHFGIKGQKWGIRRFENPDGTLTPAGKERYKAYQTAEDYEKAGESKFKKLNEAADKYTEYEGINFLENDSRMGSLCKAISEAVKKTEARFNEAIEKKTRANSMKFVSRKEKRKAIDAADLEQAKAYYDYSCAFEKAASKYISENFKPEEQDLARAGVFWAFFD